MTDDGEELARRLETFRDFLMLLARVQIGERLRAHLDPEDLVQQTLSRAYERRDQFHGHSDAQRAAWLRMLLTRILVDVVRRVDGPGGAGRSLDAMLGDSSAVWEGLLAADQTSASGRFEREERLVRLAAALTSLPEDQRLAVELKHLHGLSLVDVADRMGRTVPAIAGLLQRGLRSLRRDLEDS